ncbi:calcium/sodium antiporter [Limnochorda sp.]|uniref:calcium/sodium antiporter n=1 Tax=Limnochorda sp. TaxID=1940279 RepID=UPI0039C042A3
MESIILTILLFGLGILFIVKGGDWFADSAIWFASYTRLPKVLIGATIVSLATTIPEFTVSLIASLSGSPDTAVGNAVGSTIANMGLILAVAAIIHPIVIKTRGFRINTVLMLGAMALIWLLGRDRFLSARDGLILLVATIAYLGYQYWRAKSGEEQADVDVLVHTDRAHLPRNVALFLLGGILVVVGSRLVVTNGVTLAELLGVPEMLIALTLVSVGTSLPELVTAISTARKGHPDLSAGNIVGANILDLTWVLSGASLAAPLPILDQTLRLDLPVSFLFGLVLLVTFSVGRRRMGRGLAAAVLAAYALYVAKLVQLGTI